MTKKEIRKELNTKLVEFLKKKKCLTKYINNCYLDNCPYSDFQEIENAFAWDDTPEGFAFWNKISLDF